MSTYFEDGHFFFLIPTIEWNHYWAMIPSELPL